MNVRWLDEVAALDAETCGNKAATLSLLLSHGVSVPPGFAIGWSDLREVFERDRSHFSPHLACGGDAGSVDMQAAVLAEPIDSDLVATALRPAVSRLSGDGARLIVRSSSASEDSDAASFAGIFESQITSSEPLQVMEAVRCVYASRFSQAARAYARALSTRGRSVSPLQEMAVLIQRYCKGLLGGVVFTADPVGRFAAGRIEISRGGAEDVVSGGKVLFSGRWSQAGLDLADVRTEETLRAACDSTELIAFNDALSRLVSQVVGVCGERVDIEWVWDGRIAWVLQARAITT